MPTGMLRKYDFILNGKGYLLSRVEAGRAWQRIGFSDSPASRSSVDAKYGELPDELDHPEVWEDWSGGYGYAYRQKGQPTYHWGENFDARWARQLIHAQAVYALDATHAVGHINGMEILQVDANQHSSEAAAGGSGDVIIQGAGYVEALTPTGLPYSSADTGFYRSSRSAAGSPIPTAKPVVFGSYFYVGMSASANQSFYQFAMAALATVSYNAGEPYGYGFAVAGNTLWKFSGPRTTGQPKKGMYAQSCAANTASGPLLPANWTYTYTIGNGFNGIRDIIALDEQIFIGTPEGLFVGDSSGTFPNVLPDSAGPLDNNRDLQVFNGAVITQGISGIYSYRPGFPNASVERIGPGTTLPKGQALTAVPAGGPFLLYSQDRSPLQGVVRCTRPYAGWLYAGMWTGSESHILAGRDTGQGWSWHTMQRLPMPSKIRRLFFDTITTSSGGLRNTTPRMWALTEPSLTFTSPVFFVPIPTLGGNTLAPDYAFTPNYSASARIDLGNVDWGAPGSPKVYRSVEVWADNLLSGYIYGDIYYDVDHSGVFTLLGRAQTSPKSSLFFPTNPYTTGQSIELSLRSSTASILTTPVYRSIVLRGAVRPSNVEQITAAVRIADYMRDRQGGPMRSGATMISELRALATQTNPITLIDLAGATNHICVLPPVEEREVWQEGDDNPEIMATIKMAVLVFS